MLYSAHCLIDDSLHEELHIWRPSIALALVVAYDEEQARTLLNERVELLRGGDIRPMPDGFLKTGMLGLGLLSEAPAVYVLSMNSVDCPLGRLDGRGQVVQVARREYRTLHPLTQGAHV